MWKIMEIIPLVFLKTLVYDNGDISKQQLNIPVINVNT